ncbi:hypothetical protein AMTR_s01250p00009040, partial [Amborella trichopoda]
MHPRRTGRGARELAGLRAAGEGENPLPPPNWEQLYAAMQETIRQQGEQIRELREQRAQPALNLNPDPPAPLVVPPDAGNRLEPLYERFRKQNPPVFEGGADPLKAEQWMKAQIRKKNIARRDSWKQSAGAGSGRGTDLGDRRKRPSETSAAGPNKRFQGNQGFRRSGNENWRTFPECPRCKRHHLGECQARACFHCGMVGHMKRNCPQLLRLEQKKDDTPAPARVFALTQAEADAGPSTVTGQLSVAGTLLTVLIDSGATHSYISSRIIEKLNKPSDVLSRGFGTLLPTGELVISS